MNYFKFNMLIVLFAYCTSCLSQSNKLQLEPYQFESKSGKKVEAELGKFSVPENRSNPSSRNIDLYFVRFKSTNPNPGNPIVYLAGGPGGSGINTAKGNRFELFMAMREVADVIAFDQRGTGLSNHIPSCKTKASFPLDIPGKSDLYISKMTEAAKKCISFWKNEGVQIEGYTTIENANDLEALRKVLNTPKINLWGISYGSHLAFDFIKRYEKSIDKVVLTGLEGPDHTIKLPEYNQNFLKTLNTKIQLDNAAAKEYPDLIKLMEDVFSSLEKQPVIIEITDPRSEKKIKVGISKLDVQLVTSFFLTKNPENSVKLPYLFHQMKQGDYSTIAQMVAGLKSYAGRIQAMPLVMDAASGVSNKRWEMIKQQSKNSLLGRTTNFPFPDVSHNLQLPILGESFRENPVSSIPALFFIGTLDGRTYIESAEELSAGFINSSQIIIDGAGHDLFMSTPKVTSLMLDFFQNKKVISQTIKIKVPNFILSDKNNK
jgi:pimeloyl-ACP methyl ester carboxylesterase